MQWLVDREAGAEDREGTEKALLELYSVLGLDHPSTLIWLDSPFQGLLADAILHHQHGDSLFRGDEPRMFMALMVSESQWGRTLDGNYFPTPAWKDVPAGQRLASRATVVKDALQRYDEAVRKKGVPASDLERLLECFPVPWKSQEVGKNLPRWLAELFRPTGNHRTVLPRAFSFDSKIASGDTFTLNFPRCMNLDTIAARVYKVENLSKTLPNWFYPLRDLTVGAGWVWPYDNVALLCPPPRQSLYDERNRLHCADGPALQFPGGAAVHALHGEWVKPSATDRSAITPDLVESEPDLKKKRLLLEQLGPKIIDDPAWPEPLRQLSRMVYERQYTRFTAENLSSKFAVWPPGLREPRSEEAPISAAARPKPGFYFSTYPNGQLRVIAEVKQGELHRWLWLGDGVASGYLREAGPFAEQYYPDGRIEGFSPYDDTSPPVLTDMPFAIWVMGAVDTFVPGGLTLPSEVPLPQPPHAFASVPRLSDPADPPPELVMPSLEETLSALACQADEFFSTRWNLHRLLADELKLPADLVHELGCFGVAACRRLLTPLHRRAEEVYLRPRWDRPEAPTEAVPLNSVELYRRVVEAAEVELARAEKHGKTPFWVKNLAQPSPVRMENAGRLPVPIEWTPAGRALDPFWVCQIACQLVLRQEATRATELSDYLRGVDRERFFEAAGLAGAFLQSSAVVPDGLPDPGLAPATSRLDLVADLIAHLRTEPLLPIFRGISFPSRGPFLHSVGAWVHSQVMGQAATAEQMDILGRLGTFFSQRSANFPSQLRVLVKGTEYWELSSPVQGWPQLYPGELDNPDWFQLRRLSRARAFDFFAQSGLDVLRKEKLVDTLCERVSAALVFLASGGQSPGHPELARRLDQPRPSHRFPQAGEGYLRLLEAARWVLECWRKDDEKLATGLAHQLVGIF